MRILRQEKLMRPRCAPPLRRLHAGLDWIGQGLPHLGLRLLLGGAGKLSLDHLCARRAWSR
jgi:hypothetical protein